jgi:hypothetical protein
VHAFVDFYLLVRVIAEVKRLACVVKDTIVEEGCIPCRDEIQKTGCT